MKEDSENVKSTAETPSKKEGPCAGGVSKKIKTFRVFRSKRDGRVKFHMPIAREKHFDPTAWYLYEVERNKEIACRELLNSPSIGFPLEAYVAVQIRTRRKKGSEEMANEERVVIHGKIFVRTPEEYRIEVMKQCSFIKKCVIDKAHSYNDFARIPDSQIMAAKEILEEEGGLVQFKKTPPKLNEDVLVIGGPLSMDGVADSVKAKVMQVGKQYAMVAIEGVGYLWRVSVKDLAKRKDKKCD